MHVAAAGGYISSTSSSAHISMAQAHRFAGCYGAVVRTGAVVNLGAYVHLAVPSRWTMLVATTNIAYAWGCKQ